MHARGHCSKLCCYLFFKLAHSGEDSNLALSILHKHCSKEYPAHKKRNNNAQTCKKNPKGKENKDRKNTKKRKNEGNEENKE